MPDFELAKVKLRRRLLHQSAMGGKTHFYTSIPDPLNQQYIDGNVNDTLFRLIYTLLAQSPGFWITREWLEDRFSPNTLKKYLPIITKAKIVDVEKIQMTPRSKPANVYHTTHPDDWDMSVICDVPRSGQNPSPVKCCEKDNDFTNTSQVKGSPMDGSEVKDILNTNPPHINFNHSHTQAVDTNEMTHMERAEQLAVKLRLDHNIVTDAKLLSQYCGLIGQNNREHSLEWLEGKYPEWSLYLASQRDPRKDPALMLFNWAKGYWEKKPQKPYQKSDQQKPKTVLTDEFITKPEQLEDFWK